MASEILLRDQNFITVIGGVTDDSSLEVRMLRVDPVTNRLLVSAFGTAPGTVTTLSVVSANGFAGTVANASTTPAITLTTTITGLLKGNGTAISAATAGTDYVVPGAITSSGITMATDRILGRTTASTGAVEEITIGTGLSLSAGTLSCTITSGITVGTTTITGGTTTRILYNNAGVVGEYTVSGTGTEVALTTSPVFTTPTLGVATATSINKLTITAPATSATLTIADGKTLTANDTTTLATNGITFANSSGIVLANGKTFTNNNSITLAGTDGTTMTFPTTSKTVAANDGSNWAFTSQASGDIAYASSASAYTRLAKGTDGQVLTLASGVPSWATPSSGSSFWTTMPGTPTRVGNTSFTVTGDVTTYVAKGMIIKWTESSTVRVAMVSIPSTYGAPNTTITIIGDTMASIDASSLKYAQIGVEPFQKNFAVAGTIGATGTNIANTYYATEPMRVIGADLQVGTAGTTNSTTIDINKGGTTMFTTKPTLATTVATSPTPFTADSATSLALADKVTIDVDAVQTTNAIDLYVNLYVFPTRYLNL